ncbi:serine/threonine-protein kinase pkn2-like [Homarus americanus]|uniref:serine/threonine-protein kinase pkn2-like n=1 Tax=Homarus americanus TaxID=6706 RepID=UPI001C48CBD1|nr:serine/threonine-protein kinase pkn2-like [Homarus americanus]
MAEEMTSYQEGSHLVEFGYADFKKMFKKTGILGEGVSGEVLLGEFFNRPACAKIGVSHGVNKIFKSEIENNLKVNGAGGSPILLGSCIDYPVMIFSVCQGQSLYDIIDNLFILSPTRSINLFLPIAEGLAEVHSRGIIHNDIKGDNVLLEKNPDGSFTSHLIDFGLSRVEGGHLTLRCNPYGSHYAPELFKGQPCTPASDIYSLAVMISDTQNTFDNLWPPGVKDLCKKMLCRSPQHRPSLAKVIDVFKQSLEELSLEVLSPSNTHQ